MTVPARPIPLFTDIADVSRRLSETGYLVDTATALLEKQAGELRRQVRQLSVHSRHSGCAAP